MNLHEYQEAALTTALYPREYAIIYPALKLNGEAGEVAEKIGKILRDKNGDFTAEEGLSIARELGDVLWYIAVLARDIGFDLETIAYLNISKLTSRKERGVLGGSGDQR